MKGNPLLELGLGKREKDRCAVTRLVLSQGLFKKIVNLSRIFAIIAMMPEWT